MRNEEIHEESSLKIEKILFFELFSDLSSNVESF